MYFIYLSKEYFIFRILSEPHSKKQNNGEENTKTKTSKKDKEISYLNQPTSIQIKSDTETKLSFLSSLSCKYLLFHIVHNPFI